MEYSKYQLDVFNFIKNEKGNCVISAVAGSGKTTTIVESLKIIPKTKSILFLAFNKAIVEELKDRVPFNVKVRTFHSLGNSYILNTYPNMKMDGYKFYKYSEKLLEPYVKMNYPRKQHSAVLTEYRDLINVFRNNALYIPKELTSSKIDDVLSNIYKIQSNNFDFEYIGSEDDYIRAIKMLNEMNEDRERFDFNDMVYLPVINQDIKNNIISYDYVLVDECQDLNITQQSFLDSIVKEKTGRFIAVGDERQAIYGFAGADIHSFKNLTNKENTITLPLSFCYRCGKNMIKYAQGFVKQIEAVETKGDGIIRDGKIEEVQTGDIVLSRVNKNLISLFFSLLKENKKSFIKGKDIGENLIRMITKSNAKNLKEFEKYVGEEVKKLRLKLETKIGRIIDEETFINSSEYQHLIEKVDCIKTLNQHYEKQLKTFQDLKDKISLIFMDEGDGIMLSTVHKAKGLENSRVFILDAFMFPATFAKEKWEKIQEQNLYYVAITRAKDELVFIHENFERKIYRYLLLNDFDSIEKLVKKKKMDIDELYFMEDVSKYTFDFSMENKEKVYSYYSIPGYITFKELINKNKKILNGRTTGANSTL